MIAGLVLDFDGTILDTETSAYESVRIIYERHGVDLHLDDWLDSIGKNRRGIWIRRLEELAGLELDPEEVMAQRRALRDERLAAETLLPGVAALLDDADELGVPMAIASSSPADWVKPHLDRLGLLDRFSAVWCSGDVAETKPAPDLYFGALASLRVDGAEALAVEDSGPGVDAAQAAGLWCVAVPNSLIPKTMVSHADLMLSSLAEMSLEEILALRLETL